MSVRHFMIVLGVLLATRTTCAEPFQNLQVLPRSITKDELKAIMKAQAKALGVECEHCHELSDPAKETEKKKLARDMMRMTSDLNARYLKGMKSKVLCVTCHHGKPRPEPLGQ